MYANKTNSVPTPTDSLQAGSLEPGPYVVGVGASAGGLEALERFFEGMPVESGMAFVVVQHLSPDFKSLMDELLARKTAIPIHRAGDGMEVEPNAIYLIPPKKDMIIANRRLLLTDKDPTQLVTLPIDHFFRSLAHDLGERAIAVVLSGTGSDGSRGIRDIHEAGGLVIVQSLDTAKFDGMPKRCRPHCSSTSSTPMGQPGTRTSKVRRCLNTAWTPSSACSAMPMPSIFRNTSRAPLPGGSNAGCCSTASTRSTIT
jgi:chemotaxis response regulator CheB